MELVKYLFEQADVKSFLSQRPCQDPLENFFGCQRRGGVHDNPNVQEFTRNTQALNSFGHRPGRGNCRGGLTESASFQENIHEPLRILPCRSAKTNKALGLC